MRAFLDVSPQEFYIENIQKEFNPKDSDYFDGSLGADVSPASPLVEIVNGSSVFTEKLLQLCQEFSTFHLKLNSRVIAVSQLQVKSAILDASASLLTTSSPNYVPNY